MWIAKNIIEDEKAKQKKDLFYAKLIVSILDPQAGKKLGEEEKPVRNQAEINYRIKRASESSLFRILSLLPEKLNPLE